MPEHFFAPCPRGLEALVARELAGLGAEAVTLREGGVGFTGPFPLAWRVNLWSRLASRVYWRVAYAAYRNEDDLYRLAAGVAWPELFEVTRTIAVSITARHCPLPSLHFAALRVKDAVCDCFRARLGRRPDVDTRAPMVRIHVFLDEAQASIYLDTSGEALFKRGWRQTKGEAPLKENLAAGVLLLAGWRPGLALLDPMCGSGTFVVEAALMALDIAPGLSRRFAFEHLANFDAGAWENLCAEAQAAKKPVSFQRLFAYDRDPGAIAMTKANLASSGLTGVAELHCEEATRLSAPVPEGILVANPPYGARLSEAKVLADFYPRWATCLKRNFTGWTAAILTADTRLPTLMRLKPARRIPLYNGPIECRLCVFPLVAGSHRPR